MGTTIIFSELRALFTDADFAALDDRTRYRLRFAADVATNAVTEWPSLNDKARRERSRHLDAAAKNLQSLVSSTGANVVETYWRAVKQRAGDAVFALIRTYISS